MGVLQSRVCVCEIQGHPPDPESQNRNMATSHTDAEKMNVLSRHAMKGPNQNALVPPYILC